MNNKPVFYPFPDNHRHLVNQRPRDMLKIKDFLQESNVLKNAVDIVAIIAKIGDLKLATQSIKTSAVAAREIFLYDDTWAMIKLIVRDEYAYGSKNYKSGQILILKNVKPMKLRNYIVLSTVSDSLLTLDSNTPEAKSLLQWYHQNSYELRQGFKRFHNLSIVEQVDTGNAGSKISNCNKKTNEKIKNTDQNELTINTNQCIKQNNSNIDCENRQNVSPVQIINKEKPANCTYENHNVLNPKSTDAVNTKSADAPIADEKESPKDSSIHASQIAQDISNQDCMYIENTSTPINKESSIAGTLPSSELVHIISDDEDIYNEIKNVKKIKLERPDIETADFDNDVTNETFSTLMNCLPLNEWNEERDKYLINHISKHLNRLQQDSVYEELLAEKVQIFQGLSSDMLKSRTVALANANNYFYLMKLCGGDKITTEREKCIFVERVETLRTLLKRIPKTEPNN